MCGRFTLTLPDFDAIAALIGVESNERLAARYRRRWNVAPSDVHWIGVASEGGSGRTIVPASWGLHGGRVPLVRGEQAPKRRAFTQQRCVIPADGFYEWTGEKGARVPYWFHRPNGAPLLFAGLYEHDAEGGLDFVILTTEANATVAPVHDRMPVVVPRDRIGEWLTGREAATMIAPAPDDALIATAVSTRVNVAANDDPGCLEPAPPQRRPRQVKLFR